MNSAAGSSRNLAWISSAAPNTAVERVGSAVTAGLHRDPLFRKVRFNSGTGRLEESVPGQEPRSLAKGFTRLGKTGFVMSLRRALPTYAACFVDNQNLAFLSPPRSCIYVYDCFYLTHPSSAAEYLQGKLVYRNLRAYEAILTDSHYARSELIRLGLADGERIHPFHLDVDRNVFRPMAVDKPKFWRSLGLPEDARVLFHISSGEPRKNLEGILKAFARLAKDFPDAYFVKAGKDLHRRNHARAEGLAKELGISERVRFLGRVEDARLTELYNAADGFVFPSFAEGFGLPVLEAQACGCPVLTSTVTSLPEVSGPLCVGVDPHDIDALAKEMAGMLEDPGRRQRAAAANSLFLNRFSWEPAQRFLHAFFDRYR